jgi:uncharacterized cupredoxin-like copper-binding protein
MRVTIAIGLAMLLSACGGGSSSTTSSTTTTTTKDAAVPASVAALTGGVEGGNDCSKNPDFVPIYAGGTIRICSNAHFDAMHKTSGMVGYGTAAAPADVLAWSKAQAAKSGLTEHLSTDKMFSASEGGRTLMVAAQPEGTGSRVSVNWGKPD